MVFLFLFFTKFHSECVLLTHVSWLSSSWNHTMTRKSKKQQIRAAVLRWSLLAGIWTGEGNHKAESQPWTFGYVCSLSARPALRTELHHAYIHTFQMLMANAFPPFTARAKLRWHMDVRMVGNNQKWDQITLSKLRCGWRAHSCCSLEYENSFGCPISALSHSVSSHPQPPPTTWNSWVKFHGYFSIF